MALEDDVTEKQEIWVKAYAATRDKKYAALEAGYAFPLQASHKLLQTPAVVARLHKEIREKFAQYAADAPHVAAEIMYDKKARPADRLKAVEIVLKNIGYETEIDKQDKEPHEMTPGELAERMQSVRAYIDDLEREAAGQARVVEAIDEPEPTGLFG